MSRIGKQPVVVPGGVRVEAPQSGQVRVKGPKGELELTLRPEVSVELQDAQVLVSRSGSDRQSRAFHGMTRALIANMVEGVTKGYEKTLDIIGVGWNASVAGRKLVLSVGFCNPVEIEIPEGMQVTCPSNTQIVVSGFDKQAVGQLAAKLRATRPPEPYKGKGVRYAGERIVRKAGKAGKGR